MPKVTRLPITRYDLPSIIDQRGYKVGAEIGVDHGYFSYYLLKHSKLERLWSVDPFEGKWANRFQEVDAMLSEFGERSMVAMHTGAVFAASCVQHGKQLDFVYIDADHHLRNVRADIIAFAPLIAPGGMLAGHDYIEADGCGVIQAVNEFADARGLEVSITREPWATWMVTL